MNRKLNKSLRVGRYVRQSTGYQDFIPALLSPDPPVNLSGQLRERLFEAVYALGRLDGAIFTLPNPDLFAYIFRPVVPVKHQFEEDRVKKASSLRNGRRF